MPHSSVVVPQEVAYYDVESPCAHDLRPKPISKHIKRGHDCEGVDATRDALIPHRDIDRYHDQQANEAQRNEDIAKHPRKSQEDDCVQTNRVHKYILFCPRHRSNPSKETLPSRRRRMMLVRMFCLGSVYECVSGSDETEEEG